MNTSQELIDLAKSDPLITAAIAAASLGVSSQRVSQLAKKLGLKLRDGRRDRASIRDRAWTNHFGGAEKHQGNFIGNASELTAAADLLRHGVPVYRALTQASSCDLVVDVKGKLLRIEVRSAKFNNAGVLKFAPPTSGRYDVLALVTPDAKTTYRPNIGVEWVDI